MSLGFRLGKKNRKARRKSGKEIEEKKDQQTREVGSGVILDGHATLVDQKQRVGNGSGQEGRTEKRKYKWFGKSQNCSWGVANLKYTVL